MFEEVFINRGPLFSKDRLAAIVSQPVWDCDEHALRLRRAVEETLQKYAEALDQDATEPLTKYYVVNNLLHELGFVYSIGEPVPIQTEARPRVDYALFAEPEHFTEVEPMRGAANFFRHAAGLCQATVWRESLDVAEDPEVAAQQPMVLMDLFLRSTGVDYGLVTNGLDWRLLHRGSSDTLSTYLEVNLEKLLDQSIDHFKLFYVLFNPKAMVRGDEGVSFLDQLME
ncbi:MAG: hypothetical protein JW797_05545 [Bradymonadales bacterium]|nr:hypothetical protein [Bradymonadales bacterium]